MLPDGHLREALTFDDVLLVPAESDVLPQGRRRADAADRRASALAIPLVSSAMDTVTEAATAICMAREGGIGIVHKNLTIAEQALEVTKVKKAETGMVVDPGDRRPRRRSWPRRVELMRRHDISGLPVVAADGRPVGILTNRDIRFERNLDQPVSAMMTKRAHHRRARATTLEASKELLHKNRIEKLLVVDGRRPAQGPDHHQGHREGAAAPVRGQGRARPPARRRRRRRRAPIATSASTRCSRPAATSSASTPRTGTRAASSRRSRDVRSNFPKAQIIAGNVATAEGALALAKAGADAVKVGIGPGSICTTRVVAGVGVPQITAIADCAKALAATATPIDRRRRHQVLGRRRQGASPPARTR